MMEGTRIEWCDHCYQLFAFSVIETMPDQGDLRFMAHRTANDGPSEVKWHTLRHTAANLWILRGADIFTVSRRLEHASSSFTMGTYAHLLKGQQRTTAEALDYLLAGDV